MSFYSIFLWVAPSLWEILFGLSFMVMGGLIAPISILRYHRSTNKTRLWLAINIVLGLIMTVFFMGIISAIFFPS